MGGERGLFPQTDFKGDYNSLVADLIYVSDPSDPAHSEISGMGISIAELVANAAVCRDNLELARLLGLKLEEVEAGAAYYKQHKAQIDDYLMDADFWHAINM